MKRYTTPLSGLANVIDMAYELLSGNASYPRVYIEDDFPLDRFLHWLNGLGIIYPIPQELFLRTNEYRIYTVFNLYTEVFVDYMKNGIQPTSLDLSTPGGIEFPEMCSDTPCWDSLATVHTRGWAHVTDHNRYDKDDDTNYRKMYYNTVQHSMSEMRSRMETCIIPIKGQLECSTRTGKFIINRKDLYHE